MRTPLTLITHGYLDNRTPLSVITKGHLGIASEQLDVVPIRRYEQPIYISNAKINNAAQDDKDLLIIIKTFLQCL